MWSIPEWRSSTYRPFKAFSVIQNLTESKYFFQSCFFAFQILWRRKVAQTWDWFEYFSHPICGGDELHPPQLRIKWLILCLEGCVDDESHDIQDIILLYAMIREYYPVMLLSRWCHDFFPRTAPEILFLVKFQEKFSVDWVPQLRASLLIRITRKLFEFCQSTASSRKAAGKLPRKTS